MKNIARIAILTAVLGMYFALSASASKLCLQDSLDNQYEIRINQEGHEAETGNVYLVVTGLQDGVSGERRYLVGSGEIYDATTGVLSFYMMSAEHGGRNTTATFVWEAESIKGSLRRDGYPPVEVDVTDLGCTGR